MNTRALAILSGLALAASACVETTPQLYVSGICGFPDDPVACKAPAGKCDTFLNGHPSVSTSMNGGSNYLSLVAEVDNQASANGDVVNGRVNTHNAIIDTAKISYSAAGLTIPSIETHDVYTPVPAAGTATILLHPITAEVLAAIQGATAAGSTHEVIAHVKLAGLYGDGSSFEMQPFDIPINVTSENCVPAGCLDPTQVPFYCPKACQSAGAKCASPQ